MKKEKRECIDCKKSRVLSQFWKDSKECKKCFIKNEIKCSGCGKPEKQSLFINDFGECENCHNIRYDPGFPDDLDVYDPDWEK